MRILAWLVLLSVVGVCGMACFGFYLLGTPSAIPSLCMFLVMPYRWWQWLRGREDGNEQEKTVEY